MDERFVYYPPHRGGLIFHLLLIAMLVFSGTLGLGRASDAQIGPLFLIYLAPACLALVGVPLLAYRAYALWRAAYMVEQGGIRLRWGLREEDIPADAIQWVRPVEEMEVAPPLPLIRWPGAVFGIRSLPGGGRVEYLAARSRSLVLIGTLEKTFAISPAAPVEFLETWKRLSESVSLAPIPARSAYPSFLINLVWAVRAARLLILSGLILALILLVWVSLEIPSRQVVFLGFSTAGSRAEGVPAVQLLLLPVINGFFYLADALLGLFFFRRETESALAYLLWSCGVLSGLIFLAATFFSLRSG